MVEVENSTISPLMNTKKGGGYAIPPSPSSSKKKRRTKNMEQVDIGHVRQSSAPLLPNWRKQFVGRFKRSTSEASSPEKKDDGDNYDGEVDSEDEDNDDDDDDDDQGVDDDSVIDSEEEEGNDSAKFFKLKDGEDEEEDFGETDSALGIDDIEVVNEEEDLLFEQQERKGTSRSFIRREGSKRRDTIDQAFENRHSFERTLSQDTYLLHFMLLLICFTFGVVTFTLPSTLYSIWIPLFLFCLCFYIYLKFPRILGYILSEVVTRFALFGYPLQIGSLTVSPWIYSGSLHLRICAQDFGFANPPKFPHEWFVYCNKIDIELAVPVGRIPSILFFRLQPLPLKRIEDYKCLAVIDVPHILFENLSINFELFEGKFNINQLTRELALREVVASLNRATSWKEYFHQLYEALREWIRSIFQRTRDEDEGVLLLKKDEMKSSSSSRVYRKIKHTVSVTTQHTSPRLLKRMSTTKNLRDDSTKTKSLFEEIEINADDNNNDGNRKSPTHQQGRQRHQRQRGGEGKEETVGAPRRRSFSCGDVLLREEEKRILEEGEQQEKDGGENLNETPQQQTTPKWVSNIFNSWKYIFPFIPKFQQQQQQQTVSEPINEKRKGNQGINSFFPFFGSKQNGSSSSNPSASKMGNLGNYYYGSPSTDGGGGERDNQYSSSSTYEPGGDDKMRIRKSFRNLYITPKEKLCSKFEELKIDDTLRKKLPNKLQVTIIRARNLNCENKIFSVGSATDPKCIIKLREQQKVSSTRYNTKKPMWMENFVFPVTDPSTVLHISVVDEEFARQDMIGQWIITLKYLVVNPSYCWHLEDGFKVDKSENSITGWFPLMNRKWEKRGECGEVEMKISWVYDPLFEKLVEKVPARSALANLDQNSKETNLRLGSKDRVIDMLNHIPILFNINRVTIYEVDFYLQDLFRGSRGQAERLRRIGKSSDSANKIKISALEWKKAFSPRKGEPGITVYRLLYCFFIRGLIPKVFNQNILGSALSQTATGFAFNFLSTTQAFFRGEFDLKAFSKVGKKIGGEFRTAGRQMKKKLNQKDNSETKDSSRVNAEDDEYLFECAKEGYLKKCSYLKARSRIQNGNRNFKRCHFQLKGKTLFYKPMERSEPRKIPLDNVQLVSLNLLTQEIWLYRQYKITILKIAKHDCQPNSPFVSALDDQTPASPKTSLWKRRLFLQRRESSESADSNSVVSLELNNNSPPPPTEKEDVQFGNFQNLLQQEEEMQRLTEWFDAIKACGVNSTITSPAAM